MNNKIYAINYDCFMPYSIYVNNVRLRHNKDWYVQSSGFIFLNPFIAESGDQNILINLRNPLNDFDAIKDLKKYNLELYETDNIKNIDGLTLIKKVNFTEQKFINEGTVYNLNFNAEISYNSKEIDLSTSKDLTKIDSDVLLKKVVAFYNDFGKIINNGNIEAYKKLFDNAHQREIVSMYYNEKEANEMIDKLSNRIALSKGNLMPLEDYQMYVHPNGKIVELRTSDNKSPLYSEDDKKVRRFGVYLHMPKDSNKLEVY
ncbi:hypothetical protein M4I21_17875 [Cellulophaga sp. 20_2_10]|uniref:hypothetical protein n=1 Tax=Cellulophaga sp. 20_2_10 TaxID=2942476 RepID=UPI00201B2DF2|nr:hypothetical protein [Cellulophaga sp. 20_2_10]MCL5247686.1 hypothetical protein [Cellulophaga sp. 20_2_10]